MLKSVAPLVLGVCGIAFGIGVFVTDRTASIQADAAVTSSPKNVHGALVSTVDPNDNLYRSCLSEVQRRQAEQYAADEQRFMRETEGLSIGELRNMMAMTPTYTPEQQAANRAENFRRIKEYCRTNFPCADGAEVSGDYNVCVRRQG